MAENSIGMGMGEENLDALSLNETFDPDGTINIVFQHYWQDVLALIVIMSGLVANIFIVRAAFPLRSRRQMRFLVGWSICYIVAAALSPLLFYSSGLAEKITAEIICWWSQYLTVSFGGLSLFTILIAVDWYGSWHYSSVCKRHCQRYAIVIVVVLGLKLCLLVALSTVTCIHGVYYEVVNLISIFFESASTICVAVVNVMHKVRWCCRKASQQPEVVDEAVMGVINVHVLCWLPNTLISYSSFLSGEVYYPHFILAFCNALGFISPIIGILILCRRDGEFRDQLKTLFGCRKTDTSSGRNRASDLETPFSSSH